MFCGPQAEAHCVWKTGRAGGASVGVGIVAGMGVGRAGHDLEAGW